jgi:hypothetical protein
MKGTIYSIIQNIYTPHIWKGLIVKIYKEFKLSSKTWIARLKKWTKDINNIHPKKSFRRSTSFMQRHLTAQIVREMQIKTRWSWVLVAYTCNTNYFGDWDWQDCGLRLAGQKLPGNPISTTAYSGVHPSSQWWQEV